MINMKVNKDGIKGTVTRRNRDWVKNKGARELANRCTYTLKCVQ